MQETRLHDACDVIAVHDESRAIAKRLAESVGIGTICDSFEALLATGVDFVVLTGPLPARRAQVELAAEQSVPVLLHAPMAPTAADAEQMAAACERNEVRLGVWTKSQADPVYEQLRRMIADDWLGGVVAVQAIVGDDELLRTGTVLQKTDPFTALLSEPVHLTSWLCGRRAASVTAQATRSFGPDLDDGGVANVVLRGNLPCTYLASRLTRADAFAVHGTDGGIRIAGDRVWLNGKRPFRGHVFDYETPGTEQVLSRQQLTRAIAAHHQASELHGRFARWLEDTDDFPCPAEQALIDIEVIAAMVEAARSGRRIEM